MDVYIKSFNRPYLLHRTLASIEQNLIGFHGKTVVLDDGTPEKYLHKMRTLFPWVEIKKSPSYQKKSQAIAENKIPEKVIPAMFWKEEIMKGSETFILLEDDMWFVKKVHIPYFSTQVEDASMDMIKFMWLKNDQLIGQKVVEKQSDFQVISPRLITRNSKTFDRLFIENSILSKVFWKAKDKEKELLQYFQMYIVAGGVFSKRYYQSCWANYQNKVDEMQQIKQLLSSQHTFRVGNTYDELIKATYKTTASGIAKDTFGNPLDIFAFNWILNEAWYQGSTYPIADFTMDIPTQWIEKCLTQANHPSVNFVNWLRWYDRFKKSYQKIGCVIE